jgi:hypothetical protein
MRYQRRKMHHHVGEVLKEIFLVKSGGSGRGTRTPDPRIMIPALWRAKPNRRQNSVKNGNSAFEKPDGAHQSRILEQQTFAPGLVLATISAKCCELVDQDDPPPATKPRHRFLFDKAGLAPRDCQSDYLEMLDLGGRLRSRLINRISSYRRYQLKTICY